MCWCWMTFCFQIHYMAPNKSQKAINCNRDEDLEGFSLTQPTYILNYALQVTNGIPLQMWQHLEENKWALQWLIYY